VEADEQSPAGKVDKKVLRSAYWCEQPRAIH
jgi:hypothetical protein